MTSTSNETSSSDSADVKPECAACGAEPTPVDDLAKRIKLCREANVRAYKDGKLEIIFGAPPRASLTMSEMALAERAAADAR